MVKRVGQANSAARYSQTLRVKGVNMSEEKPRNVVVSFDIDDIAKVKRVLWDVVVDGKPTASGISRYRKEGEPYAKELSLCDAVADASRSIKSRVDSLIGADVTFKIPNARVVNMLNDFTAWGRTSDFKKEFDKVILPALDCLPMRIHAVQSKGKVNLRQVESKQVKVVTMDFE